MALFGFALLPNIEIQKEIISFRKRFPNTFEGPMLSLSENLPHISILQCPFSENIPIKDIIENTNSKYQLPITLTWDKLIYQPVGWVFANIRKIPVLFLLYGPVLLLLCVHFQKLPGHLFLFSML